MRYYGFGNYYLSSLQQGLQAHHVCAEMFSKYNPENIPEAEHCPQFDTKWMMLNDWAKNHKTIVLLNGGNARDLNDLHKFFLSQDSMYPFAYFCEDEQSLNGALTSVGIILPSMIYDAAAEVRNARSLTSPTDPFAGFTNWEMELVHRLNRCGLAK